MNFLYVWLVYLAILITRTNLKFYVDWKCPN